MALLAMNKLSGLQLNYNTTGGVPTFLAKFREALQDLKDAQEPLSDALAKSMFLSKVNDRDYRHIVDALLETRGTFEESVSRILDKYNLMNHNKAPQPSRQGNSTRIRTKRASQPNNSQANASQTNKTRVASQQTQRPPQQQQPRGNNPNYLPPEVWSSLTPEQ
jgi:hypothetical protein